MRHYQRRTISKTHRLEVPQLLANEIYVIAKKKGVPFRQIALLFLDAGLRTFIERNDK